MEKISKAMQEKLELVAQLKEKIQNSKSVVLVSFSKLTVAEDTAMRNEFRKNNVEYRVIKNSLLQVAFNELGYTQFDPLLKGTTSVAFCAEDEVTAAKLVKAASEKYTDKISAKAGLVDGTFADAQTLKAVASMPPKEVLVAKLMGSLNAPISSFVGVLSATLRSLVLALDAVKAKKEAA